MFREGERDSQVASSDLMSTLCRFSELSDARGFRWPHRNRRHLVCALEPQIRQHVPRPLSPFSGDSKGKHHDRTTQKAEPHDHPTTPTACDRRGTGPLHSFEGLQRDPDIELQRPPHTRLNAIDRRANSWKWKSSNTDGHGY